MKFDLPATIPLLSALDLLVLLFPMVFIFHDFEEILFLKPWLGRHLPELQARFPRLAGKGFVRMAAWSSRAFAVGVCEEFVLCCAVSLGAVLSGWYALLFGLLVAFTLHLLVHAGQAVALGSYVPALATSILALPYGVYTLMAVMRLGMFAPWQGVLWSGGGIAVAGGNLWLAHRLSAAFSRWERGA